MSAPVPEDTRPPAVTFQDVTKIYGAGTPREYVAIEGITFTIPDLVDRGEISSFLGPSGCGKSTVLRLVAGLEPQHPPTSGTVAVLGREIVGPGADRGMVFQDYTSFDNRTVLDNVVFGLECRGVPRREREAAGREWIARVGLDAVRDARKYPHELSGGMRQRVAIARTLILQPRVILMDEPFGALDPATRLDMQDLLVRLWREVESTVLFVTHSVEDRCTSAIGSTSWRPRPAGSRRRSTSRMRRRRRARPSRSRGSMNRWAASTPVSKRSRRPPSPCPDNRAVRHPSRGRDSRGDPIDFAPCSSVSAPT
ncbi:MAG: ABC transporter ATP-binding protein [Planctomycetaceae bacterium]